MVKQISDNEIYLLIKYIKSVLWRVAKRLSYVEETRCLKVNKGYVGCSVEQKARGAPEKQGMLLLDHLTDTALQKQKNGCSKNRYLGFISQNYRYRMLW